MCVACVCESVVRLLAFKSWTSEVNHRFKTSLRRRKCIYLSISLLKLKCLQLIKTGRAHPVGVNLFKQTHRYNHARTCAHPSKRNPTKTLAMDSSFGTAPCRHGTTACHVLLCNTESATVPAAAEMRSSSQSTFGAPLNEHK